MNINRTITSLKGKPLKKSGMDTDDLKKAKDSNGKIDIEKLPDETVGNVIMVCIGEFPITHRKQTFMVNSVAQEILKAKKGEVDLNKMLKDFLVEVLYDSIIQKKEDKDGKEVKEGYYASWVISQVLDEMGIKEYKE